MIVTMYVIINTILKQKSISVEWQPPAFQQWVHHSEQNVPGGPAQKGGRVWSWGPVQRGVVLRPCTGSFFPPEKNDRHDWKHYLPVTSLVGGNKHILLGILISRRNQYRDHEKLVILLSFAVMNRSRGDGNILRRSDTHWTFVNWIIISEPCLH